MKRLLLALLASIALAGPARAQFADQQTYVALTTGSANAQLAAVANYDLDIGVVVRANISATNTGPMTLDVNGSGVVPVKKPSNSGLLPLAAGDVVQGQISQFVFDGVEFQLLNPASVSLLNTVVYCTSFMNAAQVADGINRTDSIDVAASINSCLAAAVGLKAPAYLQAGTWKVSGARVIQDYAANPSNGINFYGDGPQNTILDAQANTANPPFLIEGTGGTTMSPVSAVYGGWQKMALLGNIAGPVLQIGKNDFSDLMNQQYFQQVSIQNFNSSSASTCYKFNANYSGVGLSLNCSSAAGTAGGNDLYQFEKVSFGLWNIGGSNGQFFNHITNDVTTGNTFIANDCEVVAVCVKIDTANGVDNSWYGGTWAYATNGVVASAGGDNHAFVPNINATTANFLSGGSGTFFELWNNSTLVSAINPIFSGAITLSNVSGVSTLSLVAGAFTSQITEDASGDTVYSNVNTGGFETHQVTATGTFQVKANTADVLDQTAALTTHHTHVAHTTAAPPTIGTGAASFGGHPTDEWFLVNSSASVSSITVNFGTTWTGDVKCVANSNDASHPIAIGALTTGLVTFQLASTGTVSIYAHCEQTQ